MSLVDGLREAARILREQSAFLRGKRHHREADIAQSLERQFDALASEAQEKEDQEPTVKTATYCPACSCVDCRQRRGG